MEDVFIVEGLRTPICGRGKDLKDVSAVNLAAIVLKNLLKNNGIKGNDVDEVILGNAVSAGLGQNPARQALVYAGLPFEVPAFTVNKVCGAGLKSVVLGAQAIACGAADILMAGGMENVSQCPHTLPWDKKDKTPGLEDMQDSLINDGLRCGLNGTHMGVIAENTAEIFKISREEQDRYALESHKKACLAQQRGLFKNEITPVNTAMNLKVDTDQKPRETSMEKLSRIPPAFKPKGTVTAGNSPAPADGAAALILASSKALKELGVKPIARILGYASVGVRPELTFTASALAIRKCLKTVSLTLEAVDLFDITESFAVQALLTIRETGLDVGRLNVFGGTIALGHPLGASGARSLVTLINALKTQGGKTGVTSVCLGGGCAVSLAVSVLN